MVNLAQFLFGKPPLLDYTYRAGSEKNILNPRTVRDLYDWYKKTPECIGLTNCITTDILSDGFYFEGAEVNRKRAMDFALESDLTGIIEEGLQDYLVAGNALFWKGTAVEESAVKELVFRFGSRSGFHNKAFAISAYKEIADAWEKYDEEAVRNRSLRTIPMTTTSVIPLDSYGERIVYRQRSGDKTVDFKDSEVIHIKDVVVPGEILGNSRMQSVIEEVEVLALIKDSMGYYFENNGAPDHIFMLPDEVPNSPSHNLLRAALQEGKKIEKKHGNLVLTGQVDVKDINGMTTDMEFGTLAAYITRVIAVAYHVPPARYGGLGLGKKSSDEGSGESMQGYYRTIANLQTKFESALNSQFFKPYFKVDWRFNRLYKEDEVREAQIQKTLTDVAEQRLRLGLWNKQAAADFLHIEKKDWGEDPLVVQSGQLNQGKLPDKEVLSDGADQKRRQLRTPKTPVSPFSQVKEMQNVLEVNFFDFNKAVKSAVKDVQSARIHTIQRGDYIELYFFVDGLWYTTTVTDREKVKIPNFEADYLANAISIR